MSGHHDTVTGVAMAPDARWAASAGKDGTVRVWDLAKGVCVRVLEVEDGACSCVAIAPNGRQVVTGGTAIILWDCPGGKEIATLADHARSVEDIATMPDGTGIISAGKDGLIRKWEFIQGTCQRTYSGHAQSVNALAVTRDSRHLVSGSFDNTIRLWEVETGVLKCIFVSHRGDSFSVAASADSLFAGTASGAVEMMKPAGFQLMTDPPHVTATRCWIFSNQGTGGCWNPYLTVMCPWCGTQTALEEPLPLGRRLPCSGSDCGRMLQTNPFVCDNSDWLT
jgi:WD40 repeat protein